MTKTLQWGGRFSAKPDPALVAFGSSLEEDLILAPFDVRCSRAHIAALEGGGIIQSDRARTLRDALARVAEEIESGAFASSALGSGAEDIHGAIDARVRELAEDDGEWLHAGRSRNDQVATTLVLYARARADAGQAMTVEIARSLIERAKEELQARTLLGAVTHWQPAQPVLFAFWLCAAAEPFVRAARRFRRVAGDARASCALGSGAVAGSSLPLDRAAAGHELGFEEPSRNAMDSIGTRDIVLDAAHAFVRAVADASRVCEELIVWCTPAFGYARLGDASSTGSSLMPQKRNPDPFELVRATAAELVGNYSGALATLCGLPLSYHRDLQQTKKLAVGTVERGLSALSAFSRAIADIRFNRERMDEHAADGYAVATDIADALIARGTSARRAHEMVGHVVARAEREGRALCDADLAELGVSAPLDAMQSVNAKRTVGSTNPDEVRRAIAAIEASLAKK
jgi:argininosuccinate lyase